MRIALVSHFYPAHGGGVEIVAAQLAARLVAGGDEVTWCSSDVDPPPVIPGVRCVPMRSWNGVERLSGFPYPLWSPGALAQLARCVHEADAVHVHDCIYASSLAAAWLARRHRKPLVVTQHIGDVPLPPLLRPALALANRLGRYAVLDRAVGVAFISPAVRQHFERIGGAAPHFHDLPNGVDPAIFSPATEAPAALRAALGFDPARPLLLFVGRFAPKKRLPIVREIAAARPDWQWCIVGHGAERPETWGLPNVQVRAPMAQAQLAAYYRAADLLVLPSQGEGFPLVVQEAMACGLPACITAAVAAGSTMPAALWLELPEAPGQSTGARGTAAIAAWLALPEAQRQAQHRACADYARQAWSWEKAAMAHAAWMRGPPA